MHNKTYYTTNTPMNYTSSYSGLTISKTSSLTPSSMNLNSIEELVYRVTTNQIEGIENLFEKKLLGLLELELETNLTNLFLEKPWQCLFHLALYGIYVLKNEKDKSKKTLFYYIFDFVLTVYPQEVARNLCLLPEYGTWEDVFYLLDAYKNALEPYQIYARDALLNLVIDALKKGNLEALQAAPDFSNQTSSLLAEQITSLWGIDNEEYTKLLQQDKNSNNPDNL